MPAPALSTLILPDPLLAGSGLNAIVSYTTADGLTADVGVPLGTNEGGLMVTQDGAPLKTISQDYRVIASGGVWAESTWGQKTTSTPAQDALPSWKGENDLRYVWATHWPFNNVTSPGTPSTGRPKGIAFLPGLNREICYHIDLNYIWVAYRDISADQHQHGVGGSVGAWVIDRCTRTDAPGSLMGSRSANSSAFGVETLRDGKLIMLIEDESGTDIDVYMSEDGISWYPVADNILARFGLYGTSNSPNSIQGFRSAVSGDYIMFTFVWTDSDDLGGNGVVDYVRSMVSSDRGASWVEVTSLDTQERPYQLGNNQWKYRYDIAGVGDDAGSFMLFIGNVSSRVSAYTAYRTGLNAWTFEDNLTISDGAATQPFGLWAARGPQYVYLFKVTWVATDSYWVVNLYLIDPRNYAQKSGWKYCGSVINGHGTYNYMWHNMRFANIGGMYLACHSGLMDCDADKATPTINWLDEGDAYFRVGGWDQLPVEERHHPNLKDNVPPYRHQPGKILSESGSTPSWSLPLVEWNAWSGSPDPGGADSAAATPWTNPVSTNVTPTWNNASSYQLVDGGVGTRRHEILYTDATPTYSWMGSTNSTYGQCGHMLEVIVKVNEEPLGIHTLRPRIGLEVNGYDVGAGTGGQHTYYVHFDTTQAALYDGVAGAWIVAPIAVFGMTQEWHKFRVGALSQPYKSGDPVDVSFWHRSEEAGGNDVWTLLGTGRLTAGAGNVQSIYWGHLYGQITGNRFSEWRRVAIYGPHDGGATRNVSDGWGDISGGSGNDDRFYDNLRGRAVTHDRVYVFNGVYATWGGGGGHEGDEYIGRSIEAFGPQNILGIGSPTTQYRSAAPNAGTTSAEIVYDAAWNDPALAARRFIHHAFAAYGYSSEILAIHYSDDVNFGTLTAAHTLDFTRWTGRVSGGEGNLLHVVYDPGGPDFGEDMSGQGAMAHYLRFTLGTTYFPAQAFQIVESGRSPAGLAAHALKLINDDYDFNVSVVNSGASFTVFVDRGAVIYDAPAVGRYMRLSMPNTSTAYGNQHHLGHFTAGQTIPLTVPLEWHFTDSENPNTTEYTTTGAKRWAYEGGPSQRVLETRMTGDIGELRQRIRRYLRVFSRFDMYPVTLLLDSDQLLDPERVFLGCVKSGAELTEYGQRYDSATSRWVTVGDMKLKLYEEV